MKNRVSKEKRRSKIKEGIFLSVILVYPVINIIIFYIFVNTNSILLSFQEMDKSLNTRFIGLENYRLFFETLFSHGNLYWQGIKNALIRYFVVLPISMILNILFALYLHKKLFASATFRIIIMLPSILSGMIVGLMFQRFIYALPSFFQAINVNFPNLLSDSEYVFGTTIFFTIWSGIGSSVIIYSNAMGGVNDEIIESAKIDGVNAVQELFYIILPLIVPTITTFVVTGIAGILVYEGPLYIFFGYNAPHEALTLGYMIFQITMKDGATTYPTIATVGILCTLVTFPVTMLVKKGLEKLDPINN